ncbi:MAG: metalloregulator ArsR/SmtB family transcription factor [Nitrososphaerales archaeon]
MSTKYQLYRRFFQAIANQTRFSILELLRDGPRSVGEIVDELAFEQSRVSHSLGCLLNCGLLLVEPDGKNRIYRLNPQLLSVLEGIDEHIVHYGQQLRECEKMAPEASVSVRAAAVSGSRQNEMRNLS